MQQRNQPVDDDLQRSQQPIQHQHQHQQQQHALGNPNSYQDNGASSSGSWQPSSSNHQPRLEPSVSSGKRPLSPTQYRMGSDEHISSFDPLGANGNGQSDHQSSSQSTLQPNAFEDPQSSAGPSYPSQSDSSAPRAPYAFVPIVDEKTPLRRGMACTFCRKRKLKCTGDRPMCTSCIKYGKHCEYGVPSGRAVVRRSRHEAKGDIEYDQPGSSTNPPIFSSDPLPINDSPPDAGLYGVDSTLDEDILGTILNENFDPSIIVNPFNQNDGEYMNPAMNFGSIDYHQINSQLPPLAGYEQHQDFVGHPQSAYMAGPTPRMAADFVDPTAMFGVSPSQWTNQSTPMMNQGLAHNLKPFSPVYPGSSTSVATSVAPATSAMPYPQMNASHSVPAPNVNRPQPSPQIPPQPNPNTLAYPRPARATSTYLSSSNPSTPDDHSSAPPISSTTNPNTPSGLNRGLPTPASVYPDISSLHYTANMDPVDQLSDRLGEFLFSPEGSVVKEEDKWANKRTRFGKSNGLRTGQWESTGRTAADETALIPNRWEHDGLTDVARTLLLDCFLAHSRLFFELSVPRFRYRMTFTDNRRPSLALLNAMYLWATRMSHSPQMSDMEHRYFEAACHHLELSSALSDRLLDAVRAAMLLSAYSYSSGRHHQGWILAGRAVRLVLSCGLHQIQSCVLQPPAPRNPFLRTKVYLLSHPEDALELGERIHTFWCAYAIDRCGAMATGFPPGIQDQDITTPFARPLVDIASGNVSMRDDVTVRDLYRPTLYTHPEGDLPYTKWLKCVTILERASKLAFLNPAENSDYSRAWTAYSNTFQINLNDPRGGNPSSTATPPPPWLDQPKFRNPREYGETKLAMEQMLNSMGDDGVFPVERKIQNESEGVGEGFIPSHTIMLHHLLAAIHMLIHDVNSLEAENKEALYGARRSIAIFKALPPMPFTDIDAFLVLVWSMIAKCLVKEMHRLNLSGDIHGAKSVEAEADIVIAEMKRVGATMHLARTQANAMDELKRSSFSPRSSLASNEYFSVPPGFSASY